MNAMRIRRFSLRRLRSQGRSAKWLRTAAALAVFGLCLVLGYVLFFPAETLRQRLETEGAARLQADFTVARLSLGLPLSLQLHEVRLHGSAGQMPDLRLEALTVRPGWLSLVTGDPGVAMRGRLYGGELLLDLFRSGRLQGEILNLQLDQLPPLKQFGVPIGFTGRLSAEVAAPASPLLAKTVTRLELQLRQAALTGLEGLGLGSGSVELGDVLVQGELQGRKLSLPTLKAAGGDLEVDAEGDVLVGSSPARSRLNLQVGLRPGEGLDPTLKDLLSLTGAKPGSDGSYRFRLSGTAARPVLR